MASRNRCLSIKDSGSPKHELLQKAAAQPCLTSLGKAHPGEVLPVIQTQSYDFSSTTYQKPMSFFLSALGLGALYISISVNHIFHEKRIEKLFRLVGSNYILFAFGF